jgi:hypothetical protein
MAAFAEKLWLRNRHLDEPIHMKEMKIGKFHQRLLKIESMATKTNLIALFIGASLFTVYVVPVLMYSVFVLDTNVLGGWIHEPLPPFAKTTSEKNYYLNNNIHF